MTVAQNYPHRYLEKLHLERLARRLLLPNIWAKTLYAIAVIVGQLMSSGGASLSGH